ncbi:Glucoside xylosyltransferase 2 [Chionoecetes opilio]|uniref:UDP-D-xylose:beta-D-glucoside alpha-1,3-D-xylosyltransferase n=1 Tax=Chionoecetes opilio TaxID=41210 RepID=A0A8J5BYV3_CHIOP|nr:Glucoside xylosyltransferase 2 [Chionoecetes opilio]
MIKLRKVVRVYTWVWLLTLLMMTMLLRNTMPTAEISAEEPEFVIVVCRDHTQDGKIANSYQRQLQQISVLLKSAAALTSRTLRFNIVSDTYKTYEEVTNITQAWPIEYKQRIVFGDFKRIYYPPGTEKMKNMFRLCATERLFLAQTFEEKDALIFLDTDVLFLRPPEYLWGHIHNFTTEQAIGIAPCPLHVWPAVQKGKAPYTLRKEGQEKVKFPTYGSSGLNAGVLLMNLTRIRSFEGGWTESVINIVKKYGNKLALADQDILNILFSNKTTATHLYELGCEWNYRPKLCSLGSNTCGRAEVAGVGVLHGAALTFYNGIEQKFQAVYEAWQQYRLEDSLSEFVERLQATLQHQVGLRDAPK